MPTPEPTLSDIQWGEIFAIASLDIAQPLLPAAGWSTTQPERRLELLRARILNARAAQAQNPEAPVRLAQGFLRSVEAELGEGEANRIRTWAAQVYYQTHADSPHWSGWEIAFGEWRRRPESRPDLPASPEEWPRLIKAYTAATDLDEWEGKAQAAQGGLLSDWDLLIFARRGYVFGDDIADPFIPLLSWIGRHRFQEFWRQTVLPLPPGTKERLRQAADASLKTMEVWMPGPLELPVER